MDRRPWILHLIVVYLLGCTRVYKSIAITTSTSQPALGRLLAGEANPARG